jgi:hypothetical protein
MHAVMSFFDIYDDYDWESTVKWMAGEEDTVSTDVDQ